MADARESLVQIIAGSEWDWRNITPERIADAILAEFDVTPRGVHNHDIDPACPETRLPDGSLRGECTTNVTPPGEHVKPTLEQVVDALAAQPPGSAEWTSSRLMQTAHAVLALFPGRTEVELRAEAWDEGYAAGLRDASRGEPGGTPNPYRQKEAA